MNFRIFQTITTVMTTAATGGKTISRKTVRVREKMQVIPAHN